MTFKKMVSDAEVLQALFTSTTYGEAAKKTGYKESTLFQKSKRFRDLGLAKRPTLLVPSGTVELKPVDEK